MLMRSFATCLLALAAAPAWAVDFCKATTLRDGSEAVAEAFVDGEKLQRVRIEDVVISGKVAMDPAASGYSVSANGAAGLTPYRTGESVADKDWRLPGSVATVFGGMTLHWPRFYKDGEAVGSTLIQFNVEGLQQGITTAGDAASPEAQHLHVAWDSRWLWQPPYGYRTQGFYSSKEVEFWSSAAVPGKSMRVDFFDRDVSRPLGSVSFSWPAEAAWNARLIEQVNALRASYAAKKCNPVATLNGDDEDEEEF